MTRQEMIAKLLWNSGGDGFGILSFANAMLWAQDRPGPGKPDLPSIVAVGGSPDDYTDEELEKLVAFGERTTARYDKIFSVRRGANLILFRKPLESHGSWMRKRLSWESGPMYSKTLDDAIAFMTEREGFSDT